MAEDMNPVPANKFEIWIFFAPKFARIFPVLQLLSYPTLHFLVPTLCQRVKFGRLNYNYMADWTPRTLDE